MNLHQHYLEKQYGNWLRDNVIMINLSWPETNHRIANFPKIVNLPLYNLPFYIVSKRSWISWDHLIYRSHYLDRILWYVPRDLIDRKYPAGLSAGKFARYGRSPVNWHARRIAEWSARRFRCEIHFEANSNSPHSERCAESKLWPESSPSFPWKILKRSQLSVKARSLRDLCMFLSAHVHICLLTNFIRTFDLH